MYTSYYTVNIQFLKTWLNVCTGYSTLTVVHLLLQLSIYREGGGGGGGGGEYYQQISGIVSPNFHFEFWMLA